MPRESNQIGKSPDDLLKYPRFDEREVTFCWHSAWWDGPLSGSISHKGERHWFNFYCDTDEPGNPYYYLVYPMTKDEADFADSWAVKRSCFQAELIRLGDYQAIKDLPKTKDLVARLNTHLAQLPCYSDRQPVAWFVSGLNSDFYGVQIEKV